MIVVALGDVIASFSSPAATPAGLGFDGKVLLHTDWNAKRLYAIDRRRSVETGASVVINSWSGARFQVSPAYDGRNIWSLGSSNLFVNHPYTKALIRNFGAAPGTSRGIVYNGKNLLLGDKDNIHIMDPEDGAVVRTIPMAYRCYDVTWDGARAWVVDGDNLRIHQVDLETGEDITSFSLPGIEPRGITFDGRYLWHSDLDSDLIYKLSVE